jgi:hypothetical protein
MTDRLTLTRAFEGAGMPSEAAERIATEIYDAIQPTVRGSVSGSAMCMRCCSSPPAVRCRARRRARSFRR